MPSAAGTFAALRRPAERATCWRKRPTGSRTKQKSTDFFFCSSSYWRESSKGSTKLRTSSGDSAGPAAGEGQQLIERAGVFEEGARETAYRRDANQARRGSTPRRCGENPVRSPPRFRP